MREAVLELRRRLRGRVGFVENVLTESEEELDDEDVLESDDEDQFFRAHRAMAFSTTCAMAPSRPPGPVAEELLLLLEEVDAADGLRGRGVGESGASGGSPR